MAEGFNSSIYFMLGMMALIPTAFFLAIQSVKRRLRRGGRGAASGYAPAGRVRWEPGPKEPRP